MFAREKRWGEKRFGIVHTHGIRQSLSTYLATRVSLGTFGCKRCVFDTKWSICFCNVGNSAKKLCKTLQACDTSPHVCVSCQQTILGSPVSPISPGNWSCQPRPIINRRFTVRIFAQADLPIRNHQFLLLFSIAYLDLRNANTCS